jgi:hypothetical protein
MAVSVVGDRHYDLYYDIKNLTKIQTNSGTIDLSYLCKLVQKGHWADTRARPYTFPVLRPPTFNQVDGVFNDALEFDRLYPEVGRVLDEYRGVICAAGAAAFLPFRPEVCGSLPDCAELYIIASNEARADAIWRSAVQKLQLSYAKAGATLVTVHTVVRTATTITALWEAGRAPSRARIMHRVYNSVDSILSTFTIPTVIYAGCGAYITTPLGALMAMTGVAIYSSNGTCDTRAQYASAYADGWAIGFPDCTSPPSFVDVTTYDSDSKIITGKLRYVPQATVYEGPTGGSIEVYLAHSEAERNLYQLLADDNIWASYEWIARPRLIDAADFKYYCKKAGDTEVLFPLRDELFKWGMRSSAAALPTNITVGDLFPRAVFERELNTLVSRVFRWVQLHFPERKRLHVNKLALCKLGLTNDQIARFMREVDAYREQVGCNVQFTADAALEPFLERARARYTAVAGEPVVRWVMASTQQ